MFNEFKPSILSHNISTVGFLELKVKVPIGRFDSARLVLGCTSQLFDTWIGDYGTEFFQIDDQNAIVRLELKAPFELRVEHFQFISQLTLASSHSGEVVVMKITKELLKDFIFWTDALGISQSNTEMFEKYFQILRAREEIKNKGIGEQTTSTKVFQAITFLNQVYFTQAVDYYDFRVIPFKPLKVNNVADLVWSFLSDSGLNLEEEKIREIIINSGHQPTAILLFPKVHSLDHEKCLQYAIEESKRFMNLSALNRGSHGEYLGAVSINTENGDLAFSMNLPRYKGNYLGGFVSGEDIEHTHFQIQQLRKSSKVQLFLELYNEARRESNVQFKFFRLWNILETISKTKNYINMPMLKWDGTTKLNSSNQPILISKQSKELVFELLRNVYNGQFLHAGFFGSLNEVDSDTLIDKILTVGYQHRNCAAHSGGCFPNDLTVCLRTKDSCKLCKLETEKTIVVDNKQVHLINDYFEALESIVISVIAYELK